MQTADVSESLALASLMAVAESQSFEELGACCHLAASRLVQAPVLGLYLIRRDGPNLMFSHKVPQGFLDEYQDELACHDPVLELVSEKRRAGGIRLLGSSNRWNVKAMNELLVRWGFHSNLCGPVFVDSQMVAAIYTATYDPPHAADRRTKRMDLICRSASIALRAIRTTRTADAGPSASARLVTARTENLPPRMADVAALICQGRTNKEIARELSISPHTVKEHIAGLCLRLKVHNRTELAVALLRSPKTDANGNPAGRPATPPGLLCDLSQCGDYF